MSAFLVLDATGAAVNRIVADAVADVKVDRSHTVIADDNRPLVEPVVVQRVPASVTNFQARAVLMGQPSPTGGAGRTMFQDVDDAIRAIGGVSVQAWEHAYEVDRSGALVKLMIGKLGMTEARADALFITASTVTA